VPTATKNPKVDAYIWKARPFAQPILTHLRSLIHAACPEVVETIKWSRPFFEYRGVILANISAFKEHCSFGFWGQEMGPILAKAGVLRDGAMGSLGRITSVNTLPDTKKIVSLIQQAASAIDSGKHISPIAARNKVVKAPKLPLKTPPEFTKALNKNKKAAKIFAAFSPSCQREYVEWIASAKREETRAERIATAVTWMAEGKQRNWKYQK
jgi:uncharacterized protein YdeI (YjbR/CyaY-like superfamily)